MAAKLGVLTIGQAPRADLTHDLRSWLPDVEFVERGALDNLDDAAIDALRPSQDIGTLTTRLRTGRSVVLGHDAVAPLLQETLALLEGDSVDAITLVCTAGFPGLRSAKPLVDAGTLVRHGLASLASPSASVGVVVPLSPQRDEASYRWQEALGRPVDTDASDPYGPNPERSASAAVDRLVSRGSDVVFLDCMGFSESMRRASTRRGASVVLARSVVARLCAELLAAQRPSAA